MPRRKDPHAHGQVGEAEPSQPGELAARLTTTAIPELEKLSDVCAVTLAGEPEPRVEMISTSASSVMLDSVPQR